jgi:hypothetical protein
MPSGQTYLVVILLILLILSIKLLASLGVAV